jgi:Family of unknown function (DUF6527)
MNKATALTHQFVEFVPDQLDEGKLYISLEYATVAHKCCCGCGKEVVTPLSPTDWKLIFDGQSVTLDPSIGNWSFPCQSHYWIRNNAVQWAPRWSKEWIEAGRAGDRSNKSRYFAGTNAVVGADGPAQAEPVPQGIASGFSAWLKKWWTTRR